MNGACDLTVIIGNESLPALILLLLPLCASHCLCTLHCRHLVYPCAMVSELIPLLLPRDENIWKHSAVLCIFEGCCLYFYI